MKYDDAAWHYGGSFSEGLPDEAGATHIGMFLGWALVRGLAGDYLLDEEDSAADIKRVQARDLLPREFFLRYCDGKLWDDDLSDEGNAFALAYYDDDSTPYYSDLAKLSDGLDSVYHIPNSWESFDKIVEVIDKRYEEWKRLGHFSDDQDAD